MEIVKIGDLPLRIKGSVVTVGGFDGIHVGHQLLLEHLKKISKSLSIPSILVTFKIPPQLVKRSSSRDFLLMTLEEKLDAIEKFGVDYLLLLEFTDEIRDMRAEEFVEGVLLKGLKSSHIVIGFNHRFGKGREGNPEFLVSNIEKWSLSITILPPVLIGGQLASSSRIRQLLLEGYVEEAGKLLGKPYSIRGKVVKGEGIGTDMGIPTANIKPVKKLIPKDGVYAVEVELEEGRFGGVLNIGFRPTFGGRERRIEVHILDYCGELLGKEITINILGRLRDEMKFQSDRELKAQIERDIERARSLLKG
jgi:riboflavin kinase/FMN adenylyltransferase